MQHGSAEPVEAVDDELIAAPVGGGEGFVELGAAGFGTAGPVEVNIGGFDAGAVLRRSLETALLFPITHSILKPREPRCLPVLGRPRSAQTHEDHARPQ